MSGASKFPANRNSSDHSRSRTLGRALLSGMVALAMAAGQIGGAASSASATVVNTGQRDTSFTPPVLNDGVRSVTELTQGAQAGKYLIGGDFTDAGGDTAADRVVRLGETVTPPNPPGPTPPTPPSAKANQHFRAGNPPAKIKPRGTTVLNKRNATTRERRPLKARARVVLNRGEVRCFRLIKGAIRKLTIRTYGKCNLRVRVTYTARANSKYKSFKKTKTYRVRV